MQSKATTIPTVSGLLLGVFIVGCASRGQRDDEPTEANVNRWVPPGTPVWEAQATMERHGFACWRQFARSAQGLQNNRPASTNLFDCFIKPAPIASDATSVTYGALFSQDPLNPSADCLDCRRFEPTRDGVSVSVFEGWYEVRFYLESNCVSKVEVSEIFKGL